VGRRRRRRRKKKRTGVYGRPFRLSVTEIELARGHDGFMRGHPEPAIVLALYAGGGAKPLLLDRAVFHVPMHAVTDFPVAVALEERRVLSADVPQDGPLLLLGLAVEVDSGELLQHLYARTEQPERFHAWRQDESTPAPLDLVELARTEPEALPIVERLHLLWDEYPLETVGEELGDDYVGAAGIVLRSPLGQKTAYRMHFATDGGDNDWTVAVTIGARW
jgi:hypothetical protein